MIGRNIKTPKRKAVLVNYTADGKTHEKALDASDEALLEKIASLTLPGEVPTFELPYMHMTHERARLDNAGSAAYASLLPAAIRTLLGRNVAQGCRQPGCLHSKNASLVRRAGNLGHDVLAHCAPTHFSQVNQYLNGVYYVGSQIVEVSPWYILDGKLSRLAKAFRGCSGEVRDGSNYDGILHLAPYPESLCRLRIYRSTIR